METNVKKLYEAMFLVDSAGVADWDAVNATIRNTLEKAEAQIKQKEEDEMEEA